MANRRRRRRRRRAETRKKMIIGAMALMAALGVVLWLTSGSQSQSVAGKENKNVAQPTWIDEQLIQTNGSARRGKKLEEVKNIVIHYVANPGTTAKQNRDYFNNDDTKVSAHFVVGLEGEVIQCIPLDEISSATNDRNVDTISIEVCHPDESGKFADATYESVVKLTAWLCKKYNLTQNDVIRHYDVTGKDCPKYYVEHPAAWKQLQEDIGKEI
ncbi:MAG: N-acetylmuramoyl-L-alanine amidase family protein [Christensenellales bacterium]